MKIKKLLKKSLLLVSLSLFIVSCSKDDEILPIAVVDQTIFSDIVLDTDSNPVEGATVSIYAKNIRYFSLTDASGRYVVSVPTTALPTSGYISLTIYLHGWTPINMTFLCPLLSQEYTALVSLVFHPCQPCLNVDGDSELYHLGDDDFGGWANSQFQKNSDGLEIELNVDAAGSNQLVLHFQAKGLQTSIGHDNVIQFLNGTEVIEERLILDSPINGSYGEYTYTVNSTSPITSVKLISSKNITSGDRDDWEFTCLYVEGHSI